MKNSLYNISRFLKKGYCKFQILSFKPNTGNSEMSSNQQRTGKENVLSFFSRDNKNIRSLFSENVREKVCRCLNIILKFSNQMPDNTKRFPTSFSLNLSVCISSAHRFLVFVLDYEMISVPFVHKLKVWVDLWFSRYLMHLF